MLLFLAIVPFIYVSLFIFAEYTNLAKSKFTLIEIGIIELNKINILINWIGIYFQSGAWSMTITNVNENKNANKIFERVFIYQSKSPILGLG
jgi:hypothetical protein